MTTGSLPEKVHQVLTRPELATLWRQVRRQLERNGAVPRGSITVQIPDQRTASEVGALLGRSLTKHVGRTTKVDLAALDQLLRNGPAQRGLAAIVASLTGQPLLQRQAERAEQATHRSAQEHEASRLVSELAPYPPARLLVDLLSGPGGPYRDHAIEAARRLMDGGVLPSAGEDRPWLCVQWLARGRRPDYKMEPKPIERGGQGTVFRAMHRLTGSVVAVKQLHRTDDNSLRRMGREIDMWRSYGNHPHIMPVLDADPGTKWFVMPYAKDGSADDHAERLRTETGALRDLVVAICEGLRLPHADKWIHRDIKPANILLLDDRWVVADWGLGRRPLGQTSDPALTHTVTGFGSEGFAAPEQASGNPHDVTAAADIYSIGRLIAAILTGKRPEQNVPLLPPPSPWLPIVERSTQHRVADRTKDIDEFLDLLNEYL
jgi:eukaryotic-like serine/threonine-protein kinase